MVQWEYETFGTLQRSCSSNRRSTVLVSTRVGVSTPSELWGKLVVRAWKISSSLQQAVSTDAQTSELGFGAFDETLIEPAWTSSPNIALELET